ncbi:TetR/AcrR family transcriptional regulator [Sulfurisoma sediminicola]|uniref:TetR family transcriptional regulator n=1 Tax=Sulfurisoma sediminicola TaxID=1381557 RepID=A0A497XDH3_9PROT|nr:TetR/AcrR family transcriptional regulator [Sulfurisoma sediminicola]RLJ65052.1 TetR family transcriptional regulator [Sulfurisoma sediminicola]
MGLPAEASITESHDSRTRLIEAATAAFLEEGYRASVERIAARAGVAKQTLYNHFPRKDDLFSEVVRHGTASVLVSLDGDGAPLPERLQRFAVAFRKRVLDAEGIAFYRAVVAEAPRFPELTTAFYGSGPAQTIRRLAAVIAEAMDAGELRRDDPVFAAEQLTSMLVETERTRRLLSDKPAPPPRPADAARILDVFLRAYAPDAPDTKRSPR